MPSVMKAVENISQRLKLARKLAGYSSATEAATALGIPYQTYAAHENGRRDPKNSVTIYSRRFGVTTDWLLTGQGRGPGNSQSPPWLSDMQPQIDRLSERDRALLYNIICDMLASAETGG